MLLTAQDIAAISAGQPEGGRLGVQLSGQVEQPGGGPSGQISTTKALEEEVAVLRETLKRERARVHYAKAAMKQHRTGLTEQRVKAERMEAYVTAAATRVAVAEGRLMVVETALAEARLPWVVRALRATRLQP